MSSPWRFAQFAFYFKGKIDANDWWYRGLSFSKQPFFSPWHVWNGSRHHLFTSLPWQRLLEAFTEISKLKYICYAVLNGVHILYESIYRLEYNRCISMSHDVMFSTGRFYADGMLNDWLMNVCTTLLTLESSSSMKHCGIHPLDTVEFSPIHTIEEYFIAFMLNKLLLESLFEPVSAKLRRSSLQFWKLAGQFWWLDAFLFCQNVPSYTKPRCLLTVITTANLH